MNEDITAIINMIRAVCFWVDSKRLVLAIEPYDSPPLTPEPYGWYARLYLYSDNTRTELQSILAETKSEYYKSSTDIKYKYGPEIAIKAMRNKIEEKLKLLMEENNFGCIKHNY